MVKLTEKLKNDHSAIMTALQEMKALGVNHPKFPRMAVLTKAALLAHLTHEEEELYPLLHEAAQEDITIQAKLKILIKDLEGLSLAAMNFFKLYENGGNETEFAEDLHDITFALRTRIRREEESLYPIYDQLIARKAA